MNKKSLFVTTAICFLFASGFTNIPSNPNKFNTKGQRTGTWTTLNDKNWKETTNQDSAFYYRIITYDQGKPVGVVKDYYLNGNLQWQGKLVSENPDIIADGMITYFNESGAKTSEGLMQGNKKNGPWQEWYADGTFGKGNYKNNQLDGHWTFYYKNGNKSHEGRYSEGKVDGAWTYFYENGKKSGKGMVLDKKKEGPWQEWYTNGTLAKGEYKNGLKQGKWVFYFPNEKKDREGNYVDGKEQGVWTLYHKNGKVQAKGNYKNGDLEGFWTIFHENGSKHSEGKFVKGEKEGPWVFYFKNGNKEYEGPYVKGLEHGIWTFYNEKGENYKQEKFVKGNVERVSPEDEFVLLTDLAKGTFTNIINKSPARYRKELEVISLDFTRSNDPLIMRAKMGKDKKQIEISYGAITLLSNLAYASSAAIYVKDGPKHLVSYIQSIGNKIKAKEYQYPDFPTFTKIEPPKEKWFVPIMQGKFQAMLAYVIAHECAHILLGHTQIPAREIIPDRAREFEYEADLLAVDLLVPLTEGNGTLYTFYSSAYIPIYLLSMSMNMNLMGFESMRDHPPEVKRALKITEAFYKKAFKLLSKEEDLKLVEQDYNNRIAELQTYNLIIQYQNYVNDPNNEVISLDEWRKKKSDSSD